MNRNKLRFIFSEAKEVSISKERHILFIDKIHQLNKAQQDILLPIIENGILMLIGASSHNLSVRLNSALLSRLVVFEVKRLACQALAKIIKRAEIIQNQELKTDKSGRYSLIEMSGGDAKVQINF